MPAMKVCATPGCPTLVPAGVSRCTDCDTTADRERGTAAERGYGRAHRSRFRVGVLRRDPICVCTDTTSTRSHHHGPECHSPSTVADHYPRSKRQLQELCLDDNDPAFGRGLCKPCHDHHTSQAQPGGWNRR